ncbi:MAG: metal-dependent phosphohydrolase, partial [Janthinobacterium lividum]
MRGEILSALSFALDITEGARPGHSVRACLLGMRLGKQIGLPDQALNDLYYALLLKDIGCSSNAARMAQAFGADDQVVKQHFKFIDREKLGKPNQEALAFVWKNIAPTTSVWNRMRHMYHMVRSPGDLTAEVIEARCEQGAVILHKLGMSVDTCAAVY